MDGGNRYIKGKGKGKAKAGYNMKEYRLLDSALNNEKVKFKDYVLCHIKKKKLPERHLSRENLEEPKENYQSTIVVAAGDDFEVAPLPYHESIQSGHLLLPQNEGYLLQEYTTNNNILAAASMSQSEEALATQSGGVYDWNMLKQSSSSETEEAVARQSGGINNFNMLLTQSSSMVEVATTQSGWINDHLSAAPLFAWPECDNVDSSVVTLPNGESIQHNHSLSQFEGYDHHCQEYASSGNNIVAAASMAESTEQVPIQSGWIDELNMLKEIASVSPFTFPPEYHTLDTIVSLSPLPPLSPLLVGGESGTTLHCGENEFECQEQWSRASEASMAVDKGSINCSDWGQSYAGMLKGFQQDHLLEENEISMVPNMWSAHNLSDYHLAWQLRLNRNICYIFQSSQTYYQNPKKKIPILSFLFL